MMRKMSRNALTLVAGLIVAAFGATPALAATSGVLYDIDFESDTVGVAPALGAPFDPAPRNKISSIFAGNPTVAGGFGALGSQVLKFDSSVLTGGGTGDQIRLQLDDFPGGLPAAGSYVFESEILIAAGSLDSFAFILDAPTIRVIEFKPDLKVTAFIPGVLDPALEIGMFAFDTKMKLRVEVDLAADTWEIFLDGASLHFGSFGGASAIDFFRFTTTVNIPAGVIAAIDNVFTGVNLPLPPPPTPTALAECSLETETLAAHCLASGDGVSLFHSLVNPFSAPEDCACPTVVSVSCVDVPGAPGACFDPTQDVVLTRQSGIEIFNVEGGIGTHLSTVYCYAIDGIRICQEFTLTHP